MSDDLQGALRRVLPKRARKLHWSDMNRAKKTVMTELIADLDMAHLAVIGAPMEHRKHEHTSAKRMERFL